MKIKDTDERFSFFTAEKDIDYLRRAIEVGVQARAGGNTPFGAILVDSQDIGRLVYGASERGLLEQTGNNDINPTLDIDCRTILERGQKDIVVRGPYASVVSEAVASQAGYWD